MNTKILLTTLLIGLGMASTTYADEVKLKRGCVKDHPLVAGETDQTLLQIYAQACDKKNKDNKNGFLAQAAQRFQQIGQNQKALQLVNSLNAQNVQHSSLTDTKFLAGIGIANEALEQMRGPEVRYLTEETYEPALALSEAVKKAKPLTVIETKVEEAPKRVQETRTTRQPARTTRRASTPAKITPAKTTTPAKVEKPAAPKRENPFGSLN